MRSRRTRGFTLPEVVTASSLTVICLFTAISVFLMGMSSWYKGQGKMEAEGGSQAAVRRISKELREAMAVTVDSDGMGISYRRPQIDGNGNFIMPVAWDSVTRRIYMSNGSLNLLTGETVRVIARNVTSTDPQSNATYRMFTPGIGSITRSITVMVVLQKNSYKTENVTSRSRETIFLRNIPQLTQ